MRILLASAVAIAPLMAASGAMSEVVVSTARTTPIATSTATGTAADNVRLASGGSIALASGTAVTVDSNHNIDLDSGSNITMAKSADGSTGIQVNGGTTGDVIIGGAITLTDDIDEYKDTDNDGDLDGPFASGTNRTGLRISGPGVRTGNVLIESTGSITVDGNNSKGVSIESGLKGNFNSLGAVSIIGNNSTAIDVSGPVDGNVNVLGNVTARGENTKGVDVSGDVTGRVNVQGVVTTTGYRYTSRPDPLPTTGTPFNGIPYLERLDADDLLEGGPAVSISGNVGRGILFDAAPSYMNGLEGDDDGNGIKNGDEDDDGDGIKNRDDADRDGDGLTDANEGAAVINSFGAAPTVQLGSTTDSMTVGVAGTGKDAYGLINRGQIVSTGVYDDVHSRAVQIGVDGGQSVTIAGGIRNSGTISATGTNGDATGLELKAGASTPTLLIDKGGIITAQSSTTKASNATAIHIGSGASLATLENNGNIAASTAGGTGNATAILDQSGTLTSLINTRGIQTSLLPNAQNDPITGKAIAIDVSANTKGFSLVQDGIISNATNIVDTDGDKVPDVDEPFIVGEIRLGSGADLVDVRNGTIMGDISFGAGADRLSISGGAIVSGAITDSDGLLQIDVTKGTLDARQTGVTTISGLNIAKDGELIVLLDPKNSTNGGFKVNGTANIADGSKLGVRFTSILKDPTRFTVIEADTLNAGQIDPGSIQENAPFVFKVEQGVDMPAGEVYIDARRRTAAEAGMNGAEASAYDVLYNGLEQNEVIRALVLSRITRDDFFNVYAQMLPDHSGGPLLSLASGVDAVTRALTGRNASAAQGETSAWLQEINFYADKDKTDTYGFRSEGFGVAGGVERGTSLGAIGVSAAFTSSDIEDPESAAEEVLSANLLELGLYWRAQGQNWTTWARGAVGYASFEAKRKLVAEGINLTNESDWHGMTLSAAAGASYEKNFGRFNLRPELYAEYFSLSEDARTEKGGGNGFDLNIEERDGHLFSGVAAVNFGYGFGENGWLRPELRVGWRQNFSVDAGKTIARFASGGDAFTIDPASIEGGGPILGLRVNVGNELGMLAISADAEMLEDYGRYTLLLRASFRF